MITFFCFHWQNSFLSSSFDIKPTNIHFQMSCCGVEGYKDFEKARPFIDQVHVCYYWQKNIFQPEQKVITSFISIVALFIFCNSQVAREGTGMVVPKSCCILKQDSNSLLITPQVAEYRIQCISLMSYLSSFRSVWKVPRRQTHSCTRYSFCIVICLGHNRMEFTSIVLLVMASPRTYNMCFDWQSMTVQTLCEG